MKIKTYIKKLQKLAEKYPNAKLIYACDDEGNSFDEVRWSPSPVCWKKGEIVDDGENNAVIIN